MSLKTRVGKLETIHGARRRSGKKPTFREWLAAMEGMQESDLDPRIWTMADLVMLNREVVNGLRS